MGCAPIGTAAFGALSAGANRMRRRSLLYPGWRAARQNPQELMGVSALYLDLFAAFEWAFRLRYHPGVSI
jgi:hypothetical protein